MQAAEKLFLQTVGRFVADRCKALAAPIVERVEKIEAALRTPAVFTPEQQQEIGRMIAAAVAKGGTDDADGSDGANITAAMVAGQIADAVAAVPHIVGGIVDRDGDLLFTNSDGSVFKVGHVVGADADPAKIAETIKAEFAKIPPPKDGKDGFALTAFNVKSADGGRTLVFSFTDAAGVTEERQVTTAMMLYRGVWCESRYQAGDSVTHEGSTWVAHADTDTRPGTVNCDWQLAVKRGRDGREGKPGPTGERGKDGQNGRDLTQLGFDGKKW